ncbi:MAG: hypothetical protein KZQ93_13540 [Candidatus Thiodiazotropha sp. (ex Monitilora ramsayi)]|nr:hypothetical protein [Candidatus Thiodiazotropha sp. (ex Monitilora ramsayi)]
MGDHLVLNEMGWDGGVVAFEGFGGAGPHPTGMTGQLVFSAGSGSLAWLTRLGTY